ncbi:hypothetical protein D9619_000751 [Psilocybe cf. subviscida]|uniref:AAA+ ATPase domain-containing protein n=1 Tax=Psilocybe cf. subviscida TaxID=2480587 RepID=A0A8H5BDZ0_9AGAR|nr:hypothetical protein D9619_000751 [Psilocybe cf. subviscida]
MLDCRNDHPRFDRCELQLIDEDDASSDENTQTLGDHDLNTAPLFTRDGYLRARQAGRATQYGVFGKIKDIKLDLIYKGESEKVDEPRLYLNTNAPFSAIVCGVQGSGKSHTVSVMLENMLISNFSAIGSLSKPLAGLVLHYGEGGSNALPSEAAWLSSSISSNIAGAAVRVYVSRASLQTMRGVYSRFGDRVVVEPLSFHSSELDAASFLSMMAVGSSDSAPLYMQILLTILRELGESFTFDKFTERLEESKRNFNPAQLAGLEQRMSLLKSFLEPVSLRYGLPRSTKPKRFCAGQLTIVDLSDPFLDVASACGLFEIIVRLFVRDDLHTGKVILVDEAHKYLSSQKSASGLTKALLSLIRQQRHLAMRVIISTQEPTVVPPVLLDLCSVAIIHRFSSPTWWSHLINHVPTDFSQNDAFDEVVRLQTGHAIVLAPSGIGLFATSEGALKPEEKADSSRKILARFGRRYLIVKTRKRVTEDGVTNNASTSSDSSTDSECEWQLLDDDERRSNESKTDLDDHDLNTAPLFTRDGYLHAQKAERVTQYGVLGKVMDIRDRGRSEGVGEPRLYLNTNAPFSAIVCGVQGSGKSHTVSVMLENMLISNFSAIGSLSKPLAGLVLHYGEGGPNALPSEAAWLSSPISSNIIGAPVRVYVSHASLRTMRRVYKRFGGRVVVEPLSFHSTELDASSFLSMMGIGSSDFTPLYMHILLTILRELGENFTFAKFTEKLEETKKKLKPPQLTGLEQRMSLLKSFLDPSSTSTKPKRFSAGQLTIIDLSDPFLDAASACGLFEIILRSFVREDLQTGKVIVVDEAHKYLSSEKSASGLTKALLSLIRQERHLAMRVIISTQEPTVVPPVLLDLCSVAIIHRFSSPTWWTHLINHVPTDFSQNDAFDEVVRLQTGHAIVLAPSGIGFFATSEGAIKPAEKAGSSHKVLARFGRRYLIVKTRKRVTKDGGASILVV